MQTRTRNLLVFALAAATAAAGLGALAHARHPPDLAPHALDAIPGGAFLVATFDLAALRASPVGAPFLGQGREIPGLGKVRDVCGFDPMDTLTEAALAIPAADETGDFGLAAAGPLDADAVVSCASKIIEARGGRPVTTAMGSFRSVRDASLADPGGEIAVRRGLLVLGGGAYLRAMIDAADGRAPTVRSSAAHGFLGHEVGEASVLVTFVLPPGLRRTLTEELENGGAAGSPVASILAGGLGARLTGGGTGGPAPQSVDIHAVLSCESAAACTALAARLTEERDTRARDIGVRVVGFGAVLDQIKIASEGKLVHARVSLPADLAALLAERLVALRGLRHPMMPPEHEGSPPASAKPPPPAEPARPDEVISPTRSDAGARRSAPDTGPR